ncbi:MAG: SDR family oxidoreductase [Balneolaceae bacterium]
MTISILGCGWLGLPLGRSLAQEGYTVKGSTTSEKKLQDIKNAGIDPFLLSVPGTLQADDNRSFFESDILFLNIPPTRGNPDVETDYPDVIRQVTERAVSSGVSWIIFASSTSVYPDSLDICVEEAAEKGHASRPTGEALITCEQELMNRDDCSATILRFGGLYGPGRHPVRYLAGKTDLPDPAKPVNLIHLDDCINIVKQVIYQQRKNRIYNAVSDGHPPRKTLYKTIAERSNLTPPTFLKKNGRGGKVVPNRKLKEEIDYTFHYPNPLDYEPENDAD